jgi:hypothetical protein
MLVRKTRKPKPIITGKQTGLVPFSSIMVVLYGENILMTKCIIVEKFVMGL